MRNPYRTNRKRSRKPLSKKKIRRYQGYNTSNEELLKAQIDLEEWFIAYLGDLIGEAGRQRSEANLAKLREMVK